MALPPVASIVAMDMEMLNIGKTIFREESALLPIKRDMNIPSIIVYSDINNIIIMLGIANFNNLTGVKCWLIDKLIKSPLKIIALFYIYI